MRENGQVSQVYWKSEFWKPRPVWVAIERKIKTELQRLTYSGKGPNFKWATLKLSCTGLSSLSLANWLKGSLRNLTSKLKVVKIDRGGNITVSTSPVKGSKFSKKLN